MSNEENALQIHVSQCEQCSGPDDGCEEGQRLEQIKINADRMQQKLDRLFALVDPKHYEQAKKIRDGDL